MSVMEIIDAEFAYGNNTIFKKLNLEINSGELFCLLGPNGCGKTTLLDCMLGVSRLQKGSIVLEGKKMGDFKAGQIARYIAYVPQRHAPTFPYTVLDIVKMGRTAYTGRFSVPDPGDTDIARECLGLVGLLALSDRPYTQLSGGESQLVMIARALAQKTPVIIMDEPTAHLDFKHEMVVLETIVDLVGKMGVTVIMATHFPNHAFYFENNKISTRVGLMHNHSFLQTGTAEQVINEENMETLYRVNTKMISYYPDQQSSMKQLIPIKTLDRSSRGIEFEERRRRN